MFGRFGPGKDFANFVNAMPEIIKEYPFCRFLLVGDGPDRKAIDALVVELGLTDKVIFTGFVKEGYYDVIRLLDIFVNSTYAEGISYVVLDAMALGKPIVATSAGGIVEAVYDGINGFLVPVQDSQSLARQIMHLLKDEQLAARFGDGSKRFQTEQFSLEMMRTKIEALIKEICE
jgi:glycosyltransferase involved in cell wall biosynthesis